MELKKVYKFSIFNNGSEQNITEYVVRFKSYDGKHVFRVKIDELLLLLPNQTINSCCKKVKITLKDLDQVEVDDGANITYLGFHKIRENIRHQLSKKKELIRQIEDINKRISKQELRAYLGLEIGEREGFSLYFRERYPIESKRKFGGNIGTMLNEYQFIFENEKTPKQAVRYYKEEFRTRYRENGDSYVYPIDITYIRYEVTYRTKVEICTLCEFCEEA